MTTVSVVIPVYNGSDLLPEALGSVYSQTLPPDEVLVVNDGSTDDTVAVLRELESSLPSTFHWVSQHNRGEASARKRGVEMATGDVVAFLDHDDLWLPTKLRRQIDQLTSQPDLGASFTACNITTRDTVTLLTPERWDPDPGAVLAELLKVNRVGTPSTVVIRRDALERVPVSAWHSLRNGNDWLLWLHLAATGVRFGFLSEPLVEYRVHGSNKSANLRLFDCACDVFEAFFGEHPVPVAYEGDERSPQWWLARWHLEAAIRAVQDGDRPLSRRHIVRAARVRPAAVRPGWLRMLGVGPAPR